MTNSQYETKKRLDIAKEEIEKYKGFSLGIFLAGSVAYAPNTNVRSDSDIDLVVVVQSLKATLKHLELDKQITDKLQNRFFEGYCLKSVKSGVPVSTHLVSADAFDIVGKCFVGDIRVFRPQGKDKMYKLRGFEGNEYAYTVKNIPLREMEGGVRTIVPVAFVNEDRYYIGIHRDKMLSNPVVLYEPYKVITLGIDRVWSNVTQNLRDESIRLMGKVDLQRMNVLNALVNKDKMNPEVVDSIVQKTKLYMSRML